MKTIKIGYVGKQLLDTIYDIINIIKKYNLDINIEIVDDYTVNECDLVLYSLFSQSEYSNDIYLFYNTCLNKSFFNKAKGNPKFLFFGFAESHFWPYINHLWVKDNEYIKCNNELEDKLIRTINNYVPYNSNIKCYGITSYEDTTHNMYAPYCIMFGSICDILYNDSSELINRKKIKKTKFCNMFYNHGSYEREIIYQSLNNYKQIDSYSNFHKNQNCGYIDNSERFNNIMPSYKFSICFENCHSDYNEGYITEKICDGFFGGTVPIYWGNNKQIYEIFNEDSFINLTDVDQSKWLDIIKKYDEDDELYYKMLYANPIKDENIYEKYVKRKEEFIIKILNDDYYFNSY